MSQQCNGKHPYLSSNNSIPVASRYIHVAMDDGIHDHIVMFANLVEARAGAAECHRDVTGTTLISLQRLLFPLHHCDIHELELKLEARACAANALAHGGPGAWSLENGR